MREEIEGGNENVINQQMKRNEEEEEGEVRVESEKNKDIGREHLTAACWKVQPAFSSFCHSVSPFYLNFHSTQKAAEAASEQSRWLHFKSDPPRAAKVTRICAKHSCRILTNKSQFLNNAACTVGRAQCGPLPSTLFPIFKEHGTCPKWIYVTTAQHTKWCMGE